MTKYAGIIIYNDSVRLDRIFTYIIPNIFSDKIYIGMMVSVPFGKNNREVTGFVIELYDDISIEIKMKEITKIFSDKIILRNEDIELIKLMRTKYLATYLECIKTIIPSGMIEGKEEKKQELLFLGIEPKNKFCEEPYKSILEIINKEQGKYNINSLSKAFSISVSSIKTLIKHGYIVKNDTVIPRYNNEEYVQFSKKILNNEQSEAYETIINSSYKKFLLHGVTGSGKTEVYMHLVEYYMNENKSSIILVPEIALTPQMIERFKGRFGKNIAVFHSRLSSGERFDEWMRVKNGTVKLAVGARSAVFLPFQNLGLIIVDEEHENSYKSDSDPKYNAKEIAEFRSEIEGCKILLGSATPSVETYYKFSEGKDTKIININKRINGGLMPNIEIVDMRDELKKGNKSIFSVQLFQNIKMSLDKKEQVILFLNRRGFSTFVSCRKCGYVFKCENCDISLTYHSNGNYMSCHYCGCRKEIPKLCPKCGSKYVKYFGAGTEKVQEEIKKYFKNARVLRMDYDTTRDKNSYKKIYENFRNGDSDILVGTQMISKGLDFNNVTLVGIIAADLSLNFPDFRSGERTFELITQVAGRSGRGEKKGKVILQTYSPEHYSINYAMNYDYKSYYEKEIEIRKSMGYPPFSRIMSITVSSQEENLIQNVMKDIGNQIENIIKEANGIQMLGPSPCSIFKIKNEYRWHIILRGNIEDSLAMNIRNLVYDVTNINCTNLKVSIDMNPNSFI